MNEHIDNDNETWRPAPGYEGIYEVSSYGNIRSVDRTIVDYRGFSRSKKGKTLSQSKSNRGYMLACMCDGRNKKERQILVHRLVAEAFVENNDPVNKTQVNHINGDKTDNTVSNIEWVSPKENVLHAEINNLCNHPHGENRSDAELTYEQVSEIRNTLEHNAFKVHELAEKFKVSAVTIRRAATGNRYSHCSTPPVSHRLGTYTPEFIKQLKSERNSGVSVTDIARKHNIPKSSLYELLRR